MSHMALGEFLPSPPRYPFWIFLVSARTRRQAGASASPPAAGLAFGLGFHVPAHGVIGPALGVAPEPPWQDGMGDLVRRGLAHALSGVTAAVAFRVARRL